MSKTKIAILSATVVTLITLAWQLQKLGSEVALMERFPNIDPKIVVKAHRQMIKNTFKGMYNDRDMTDAVNDEIFLEIVQTLTK